jgi:hypothetical protein
MASSSPSLRRRAIPFASFVRTADAQDSNYLVFNDDGAITSALTEWKLEFSAFKTFICVGNDALVSRVRRTPSFLFFSFLYLVSYLFSDFVFVFFLFASFLFLPDGTWISFAHVYCYLI